MLKNRPKPEPYDHALRYWVASHTVRGKLYLVEFDAYDFNGECQCKNFAVELAPLLKRGITPAEAVAGGMITLRDEKRPEDALRCIHICDGFMQLAEDFARAVVKSGHTKPTNETNQTSAPLDDADQTT